MLDLDRVDLSEVAMALEDHSPEHSWWLDPVSGELELRSSSGGGELELGDPDERDLVAVEPVPSDEAYADMEDFIDRVPDPRPRDLLERAIVGRGAFRRFKDTLVDFPDLREAWFAFSNARMERRALEWLRGEGLIDRAAAEEALADRCEQQLPPRRRDGREIARGVAAELRELHGERLRKVVLFGSWARGDADIESDIDLMVVLDRVGSRREERRRAADLLLQRLIEEGAVISQLIVSQDEYERAERPVLMRARAEGIEVG